MGAYTVNISFQKDLLDQIDKVSGEESRSRSEIIREAERYIGMEYEWGGEDFPERGIDCSGRIYFIDSTYIESLGINGVTYRDYPADSLKIKSYGRMLLECLD